MREFWQPEFHKSDLWREYRRCDRIPTLPKGDRIPTLPTGNGA
ncbi:MAG: hypothetical protein N4J56_002027 [Chroococcidiopsis sp. SAG 2025]|nr:hypothetical protein [Chroococcidiopsis sp. SAG 2025]MDV2992373.1 hypothetical protein [Chroococcidiopsis sp. SAG 2025]